MSVCWICLDPMAQRDHPYHARCLQELFGTSHLPALHIELARLHTAALAMVGHTSLSGIQRKVSLQLSTERDTLQVAICGGLFLLKPQAPTYPFLPENEHVTTRLAQLVDIPTAQGGLVKLHDGSTAYLARRFDRLPDGRKLRQEDFCQLAGKSPKEKYDGSAELCVRLLRKYASEPLVEMLKLFRLLVFTWWTGNGDMHLKNFSLTAGVDGRQRLSPAYDQACTRLVIPHDQLALPVQGLRDGLTRDTWHALGDECRLPRRAIQRVFDQHVQACDAACQVVERSLLADSMKREFAALLRDRGAILAGR